MRIFGPLQVERGGSTLGPRELGGSKPKQLFELLVLERGRAVPKDRLADLLWGEALPRNVSGTIETYVSLLRRHLRAAAGEAEALLTAVSWLVLLWVAPGCASAVVRDLPGNGRSFEEARAMSLKLRTDVKGEGAPLVFVGGGLTGYLSWVPHQQRLLHARKVVRAQPLSVQYGLEDRPLPPNYSVEMESRALAAALDGVGLHAPVDLVAWSYGAAITLDFALDHPDRVRTLTLIEPPALWVLDAAGSGDADTRSETDELRRLHQQMSAAVSEEELATFVRRVGLCPPGETPQQLPAWPVWVEHRRSLRTRDVAWTHTDTAARLRAFARPVLLVKGAGSAPFLHRIIEGLAATLPRSETVELPGAHAPQIVAIDAFLTRMSAFQSAGDRPFTGRRSDD